MTGRGTGNAADEEAPPGARPDGYWPSDPWASLTSDHDWLQDDDIAKRRSSRPSVTIRPADPYASPVHAPSGYTYASWWRRFAAFTIDGAVMTAVWTGLWFVLGATFSSGQTSYLLSDLAGTGYLVMLTAGPRGQTPGMRAIGIAIKTRDTGGALGYRKAIIRSVTMMLLAAPGAVLFLADCLFPLWHRDRQALHDMAAGTVVVDVRHGAATEPIAPPPASPRQSAGSGPPASGDKRVKLEKAFGFAVAHLRHIPRRFWITGAGAVLAIVVVFAGIRIASAVFSGMHSPSKAATAYLEALSRGDVSGMLDNAGIVTPQRTATDTNDLLSVADIRTELRQPGNGIGQVSNVAVESSTVHGNTATVLISYVAGNAAHSVTYSLIRSEHTSTGWAVQITPARLDIDVPSGGGAVRLDGMPLTLDGQVAHVYLFPSIATVSMVPSAIWKSASTTVDTTGQGPSSDAQEISLSAQLLPAASQAATQAVASRITQCLAAASLAPANCPNVDSPNSITANDTFSAVKWSETGNPAAWVSVSVDRGGIVTVSGSITVSVSYTDNSPGDGFLLGPSSTPEVDGPTAVSFSYPVTWNGSGWVLGALSAPRAANAM